MSFFRNLPLTGLLVLAAPLVQTARAEGLDALEPGAKLTLAPTSALATALDALLPVSGTHDFFSVQKQVVLTDGASGQHLLVTCTTETMPSRAPQPLSHFLGCEVTPVAQPDAGTAQWSLAELFTKAAAVKGATGATEATGTPPCNPHSRLGCDG